MKADSRIGILHLISGLDLGGAEMMLLWTARHFDRESFDLMVVSLMSGGPMASLIRAEGVEVVEMGQKRGRLSPRTFFRLVRLVRSFAPAIIQGHLFHSNVLSRFLVLLVPGARSISTRHNEVDNASRRTIYSITALLSAGTVVFSEPVRRHAAKDSSSGGPVHLAPYGIDPQEPSVGRDAVRLELGLLSHDYVWMAVGRLTRQKGFDILIEAFSSLCKESEMTPVLLFVGDGEDRGSLEAQASGMVEEGFVRFLGQRDDVANLLGASDAFVLSSLWEGGPLVVLEAMAAGVPVVATRVGDASNMVVEGETGVLVQPGDVADLAGAMRKVMEQGQEASQWGLRGKERVESKYSYGRTQRSMEEFYRSLARPGRNG